MTPDRWQEIRKLFGECLEAPIADRGILLAAHSDDALRAEVEKLLEGHDQADANFLQPPSAVVNLSKPATLLSRGTVVAGRFEILRLLGRGGMAEVYEAYDKELSESIAIKAMAPQATADTCVLLRELQLSRRVSHPNICRVFDFLRHEGPKGELILITMELVPGITLEERIKQGPIATKTAAKFACQLLSGLAAAHGAGVIHRDLKPSNIIVSGERAVITDFGVARSELVLATSSIFVKSAEDDSSSLVGTLNYMAPEQLLGEAATRQSDLYSLGLVLYETVSGCRPFAAERGLSGLLRRFNGDVQLPSSSPCELARAIEGCLKRHPAERPNSAEQVLSWIGGTSNTKALSRQRRARWVSAIAAAAALALAIFCTYKLTPHTGLLRTVVDSEPQQTMPLTAMRGAETHPAFSPDGKKVAFTWNEDRGSTSNVYVRDVTGGPVTRITSDTGSDTHPAWSSDGHWIAYIQRRGAAGDLMVTAAAGGEPRRLAYLPISQGGICWSHRGRYLVYTQITFEGVPGELHVLDYDKQEDWTLTAPPRGGYGDLDPAFSPDDRWIAFIRFRSQDHSQTQLEILPVSNTKRAMGPPTTVLQDTHYMQGLSWTASDNSLLFSSLQDGNSFSLWRLRNVLRRSSRRTAERVVVDSADATYPSVSPTEHYMAYEANTTEPTQITRISLSSRSVVEDSVCPSSREDTSPQLSRNGDTIYSTSRRSGTREIWSCNVRTGTARQLTFFNGVLIGSPRLSPDGTQLVFDGIKNGYWRIFLLNLVPAAEPKLMLAGASNSVRPSWSHDGRWIYFSSDRTGDWEIWRMPAGGGPAARVTRNGGWDSFETADGQKLYFTKRNQIGLWSRSLLAENAGEQRTLELADAGRWAMARDALYFLASSPHNPWCYGIFRLGIRDQRTTRVGTLSRKIWLPFEPTVSVSYDGKFLAYASQETPQQDILLVKGFR